MRSETWTWIWIVVLILLLTGTISLGDIFSLIFGVIGFFILLALIGSLIFRHRVRRAQQEVLRQPIFDYAGGFSPALLELSDALPFQAFLDAEE